MTVFDTWYRELIVTILEKGVEEKNERTGFKTRIITGVSGSFRPADAFPLLTLRNIPLKIFTSEQIWYLQGDKELDYFQQFSKIWDDFKEGDGNYVESGYGYRWRKFFERDQVEGLIDMLKNEPSSRQGVVVTWDPNTDGLASAKKKNVPCVPMWIVNIVGGELNLHFVFRSSDAMLGLPHDIAGFALLQLVLAQHLGVKPGWLHYSGSHVHIYENHFEQARELVLREQDHPEIILELPAHTYERAINKELELVTEIVEGFKKQYMPMKSLGKMAIAL